MPSSPGFHAILHLGGSDLPAEIMSPIGGTGSAVAVKTELELPRGRDGRRCQFGISPGELCDTTLNPFSRQLLTAAGSLASRTLTRCFLAEPLDAAQVPGSRESAGSRQRRPVRSLGS